MSTVGRITAALHPISRCENPAVSDEEKQRIPPFSGKFGYLPQLPEILPRRRHLLFEMEPAYCRADASFKPSLNPRFDLFLHAFTVFDNWRSHPAFLRTVK